MPLEENVDLRVKF